AKQYAALVQRHFPLGLITRHLAQPPPPLSCSRLYGSSVPHHSKLTCRRSSKAMLTGSAMAVATRVLVPPASTIWRARRAATTTKVYLLSAFSSRASRSSCMGLSLQPEEMTGVQVALDPASLGS